MLYTIFLFLLLTISPFLVFSGSLSNNSQSDSDAAFYDIGANITGVFHGSVLWGDYDNDGDLDVLVIGRTDTGAVAKIYRNDDGSFVDIKAGIQGVFDSNPAAWMDYDNDGDLDIFLSGATTWPYGSPVTKIYQNNSGTFNDIGVSLPALTGTFNAWGDYDNDGDLDLLLAGATIPGLVFTTGVYRNNGGGNFTNINAGLPGLWGGAAAWGDYDNDGDLDLLLTGYGDYGVTSEIYRNDAGLFSITDINLQMVNSSGVAWGDFDNDSDLDILLTGNPPGPTDKYSRVYRNDNGSFSSLDVFDKEFSSGGCTWGDYDNDGDLDGVLSGQSEDGINQTIVYRNDGAIFTNILCNISGGLAGTAAFGDYDNDGDLDLIVSGTTTTDIVNPSPNYPFVKIYRNNLGTNTFNQNTLPTAPTGLSSAVIGNNTTLSWNKSIDNETPQVSLTYNIRVGTTPGGVQIVPPLSIISTGYRKIVQLGNTNHQNNLIIKNLPPGKYYWSVQTIDGAYAGSVFSGEHSFDILSPLFSPEIVSIKDIPNDQGGYVTLKWNASSLDTNVNGLPYYSIWRALPEGMEVLEANCTQNSGEFKKQSHVYRVKKYNGINYAWEWITNLPAHRFSSYSYTAQTLYDSSHKVDGKHYFLVSAQTNNPDIFYDSNIDSGHSVDNIPPSAVTSLAISWGTGLYVTLGWAPNEKDIDFQTYEIYRSNMSNFTPTIDLLIFSTFDTKYQDMDVEIGHRYYYKILCVDSHGNRSQPSEVALPGNKINRSISLNTAWNIVSVPLDVDDFTKTTLFSLAVSNAFQYNGTYESVTTLKNGKGYWIKFGESQEHLINGYLIQDARIDVKTGWNIIGSISETVMVSNILSAPSGMVTSQFFGFDNGYRITNMIAPGKGYWVKVENDGQLILSSSTTGSTVDRIKIIPVSEDPPGPPEITSAGKFIPDEFILEQNYPNPFNPSTVIRYGLPEESHVILSIYNALGQLVTLLIDEKQNAGIHEVTLDVNFLTSGVYFYRLQAGDYIDAKKFLLMK